MPFAGEPSADNPDTFALAVDYLDWYSDVLLRRLDGLSTQQQTTPAVPSGWSALGLVEHSAAVRRYWVRHVFTGEDVDFSWPGTEEQEWEITGDDTLESIRRFYLDEHEHFLRVLRSTAPEALSVRSYGDTDVRPTLAWSCCTCCRSRLVTAATSTSAANSPTEPPSWIREVIPQRGWTARGALSTRSVIPRCARSARSSRAQGVLARRYDAGPGAGHGSDRSSRHPSFG